METHAASSLYQTRLFLLLCTLPQVIAVYCCVLIPRLVADVLSRGYFPEGTQLPKISMWFLWASGAAAVDGEAWPYQQHKDVAICITLIWLVAVFALLWWRQEREIIARRWIYVSTAAWTVLAAWLLLATPAAALPLIPIIAEMKMNSPTVLGQAMDWGWGAFIWAALKFAIFASSVVIVGLLWWRDRRRSEEV